MLYAIAGTVSSALFIGCLWGLYKQIINVRHRRELYGSASPEIGPGYATRSLSANGFASSFFAFYAFLIYAMSLDAIEPFVFVTRLMASLSTLYILFEIYRDRSRFKDRLPFQLAALAMVLAGGVFIFRDELLPYSGGLSRPLTVVATLVMLQGGLAQIRRIFFERCTGAMSLAMNWVFLLKDLSNVFFGMVIGLSEGWPIILMGAVSATLKMTVLLLFVKFPREPGIKEKP